MNIYWVARTDKVGYDEYDSFVVVAPNKHAALYTHPDQFCPTWKTGPWDGDNPRGTWTKVGNVEVALVGKADNDEYRIVCASFNAG